MASKLAARVNQFRFRGDSTLGTSGCEMSSGAHCPFGRLNLIKELDRQMLKTVRRDKAPVHSGRQTRPGTNSLHPVAIEATAEATKPLKPSV